MLKRNGCAVRVVVAIYGSSSLADCGGSTCRIREVGAIVATQSSLFPHSLSPATMYFSRGLFLSNGGFVMQLIPLQPGKVRSYVILLSADESNARFSGAAAIGYVRYLPVLVLADCHHPLTDSRQ